ncbi:MAG TPA: hypothetical protein VHW96_01835 [Solirubrobacteraceae bacterium]|nr:hypothetical protein [Solirubrobacteraceae bacterium]
MARLRGCLATLDRGARRLLSLRAGLHAPARSAAATARILHVSARREAILERLAVRALGRSAATGCAGSPAAVAPALASAGLPAPSSLPPGTTSTGSGPTANLRGLSGSRPPSRRGGGNVVVAPSGARTERAETSASFPSALVTALLGLLLAIAIVVVPKLRHRAVSGPADAVGAHAGLAQTHAAPAPAPAPGAASGTSSVPRPQNETAAPASRARVAPMDSAIGPMAADAFSQMASDADQSTDPENEPRAEDESEDQGDTK